MTKSSHRRFGDGVYYAVGDYPGYTRRIFAIMIDFVVLVVLFNGLVLGLASGGGERLMVLAVTILPWAYLAILKASPVRTVGFRMMRLKIVNLKGERPSILWMTCRVSFWLVTPIQFFLDLLWISMDTDRQSLRDCLAGTSVVDANAEPIGKGAVYFSRYFAVGLAITFPRVQRDDIAVA